VSEAAAAQPEPEGEMSQAAIAELIERNLSELIQAWTRAVRVDPRIVSDSSLTTPELIDHVPAIVAEICALMRKGETPGVTNTHEARANVYTRVAQGYSGRDLIRELSLLRIALIDFVMETATSEALGLSNADRHGAIRVLNLYLDEEMRYAITVYCGPGAAVTALPKPPGQPVEAE
jgi:hypothetical protein